MPAQVARPHPQGVGVRLSPEVVGLGASPCTPVLQPVDEDTRSDAPTLDADPYPLQETQMDVKPDPS
eukprot:7935766-Prorocentrum_lima.AAC.1